MLNATCQIEEEFVVTVLDWICLFISIPIYTIAFVVLLMKCPEHFNEYRKLLVIHIISGVLMDLHIGEIWKVVIPLPWPAMCSVGYASEHAVICFQIFVCFMVFTGITTLYLFIYRMNVATKHVEHAPLRRIVLIWKNLCLVFDALTIILSIFIYPELKQQNDYMMKMEMKIGIIPDYIWCGNCYFMRFDSWIFLSFYIAAYCALFFACLSGIMAAVETIKCLKSSSLRLSARTIAIQKNLIFSLLFGAIVHITLMFVPLGVYFVVNLIIVDVPYLATIFIAMLQNHGSASTLIMLLTNNLLRKTTRELYLMPKKFCLPYPRVLTQNTNQVRVVANNQFS